MSSAPLVFPKAKPIGVNSSSSREAITSESAFPTKVIDYLKFDIFDQKTDTMKDSIYLYLPKNLVEGHRAKWDSVALGPAGAALTDAAADVINSGGDVTGEAVGESIKKAAEAAMPQLGYKAAADVINKAISATGGTGSLSRDQLTSITGKKIFNPYMEATYGGQDGFRSHSWDWQLVPKSADDVMTIYNIIKKLRLYSLPGKGNNNWLTIPEYFRCTHVRYIDAGGGNETINNPETGGQPGLLSAIMQFPTKMVLKSMTVNMSDYSSLKSTMPGQTYNDFGAMNYSLKLDFMETAFLTKETYQPIPAANPNISTGQNNYTEDQQQWMDMISDMLGDFGPTYQSSNVA